MEAFTRITSTVAPLDRVNVDTDAIIPKQFLKSIRRSGFGPYLFDEWRYLDRGEPDMDCSERPLNPDFVLNQPAYRDSCILLARENFGCGSSREHAPWALLDYGFRVVIAPSFADIFYNNCLKNGILPVKLSGEQVNGLFADCQPGYVLSVDLVAQQVGPPGGNSILFQMDEAARQRLLQGLDDIACSLRQSDAIRTYEQRRMQQKPWLFAPLNHHDHSIKL